MFPNQDEKILTNTGLFRLVQKIKENASGAQPFTKEETEEICSMFE